MECYPLRLTPGAWNSLLTITRRLYFPGEPLLALAWPFDRAKISERALTDMSDSIPMLPGSFAGKLFVVELAAEAKGKGARA